MPIASHKLSGVFCALWTPTGPAGEILWPELERHLAFLVDAKIDGFMALGSTAEFPHLTLPQRKEILERLARTHLPLIANVSDVSHRNAIELSRHAKQCGAVASAVLPPWFFPMQQRDLAEYFISISQQSEMPLVLYNFPEVTGKKIELETIRRVAAAVPVLAVKQSGGEFQYHDELLRLARDSSFVLLTGADTRLEQALQLGCAGTVSGLANAVPEPLRSTFDHFKKGTAAQTESRLLQNLETRMGKADFPLNVKAAIAARGFETGALKNPVSPETLAAYESLKTELEQLFAAAGLSPKHGPQYPAGNGRPKR